MDQKDYLLLTFGREYDESFLNCFVFEIAQGFVVNMLSIRTGIEGYHCFGFAMSIFLYMSSIQSHPMLVERALVNTCIYLFDFPSNSSPFLRLAKMHHFLSYQWS